MVEGCSEEYREFLDLNLAGKLEIIERLQCTLSFALLRNIILIVEAAH